MDKQTMNNKKAREAYLANRNVDKGIDMIKKNHVAVKDITSGMVLFKEFKNESMVSTYYDRVEIRKGNKLEIIKVSL